MSEQRRRLFRRHDRITASRDVDAVFAHRARCSAGPLRVHGRPNGGEASRLAVSLSRRVGSAVIRNRIRRRIREAFRTRRHEWPTGWDIVVVVHPHTPLDVDEYARHLGDAVAGLAEAAP